MKKNPARKKKTAEKRFEKSPSESIFLKACRGEIVDHIPVWFMRQAGRSLPGYRALRKKHDILTLTRTPELAAQVSMEPIELLGVDAAILFADIMLLPIAMGIDVKIVEGIGPVIDDPIDTPAKIGRLKPFLPERIAFLQETIRILRGELGKLAQSDKSGRRNVPLIGFAGAPFTLASYLIEGKPTRTWAITKRFMLEHPEGWDRLMSILSDGVIGYLHAQVDAGAQAAQIFDSWVGCLSPAQYRRYVLPHMQRIFAALRKNDQGGVLNVPRIHFATDTAGILKDFSNVDCEVVGVDWRIGLAEAREKIGNMDENIKNIKNKKKERQKTLQGNLDPLTLLAPWKTLRATVDDMLSGINPKKGYIFNLGHGVPPEADDKVLRKLVEYIHGK